VSQIQFRRGSAAQWTSNNPVLASGEMGVETDNAGTSSPLKTKMGDGTTAWNSLPYDSVATLTRAEVIGSGLQPSDIGADVAGAASSEATRAQAAEALLVPLTQKGAASGVASLDSTGKLPTGQVPTLPAFLPLPSGDTSGATDAANLNTLLAAGGTIRPNPLIVSPTYYVNTTLIGPAGGNLDIDWGDSTIVQPTGSNCNLFRPYCYAHPAATGTASITSGTNTVTSAVAVSVGQTVAIVGAGGNGNGPLVGNVATTGSGTFTVNTLDGRPLNCTATVSGAAITVYNRDQNISFKGGIWQLGNNAATGINLHAFLFRFIDNLTVEINETSRPTGAGKYMIAIGGCTNVVASGKNITNSSDGIHFTGPCFNINVPYLSGSTGDDLLALTCGDYSQYADTGGDIIGVTIGTVQGQKWGALGCLMKLIAGAGWLLDDLKVEGQILGAPAQDAVYIGDDPGQVATVGGTYGNIDVGTVVASTAPGYYQLYLGSPAADRIAAKLHYPPTTAYAACFVTGASTVTINELDLTADAGGVNTRALQINSATVTINMVRLRGHWAPTAGNAFVYAQAGTVNQMVLEDITAALGSSTGNVIDVIGATVGDIVFRGGNITGTLGYAVYYTAGTISRVRFIGTNIGALTAAFRAAVSLAATDITLDAVIFAGTNRAVDFYSSGTCTIGHGCQFLNLQNAAIYASGATVRVVGAPPALTAGTFTLLQRAASEAVSVNGPGLSVDLAILTPLEGDMVIDSSSRTGSTGVAVHHTGGTGNGWKNLYSGATY
jgi:hypothetical protein